MKPQPIKNFTTFIRSISIIYYAILLGFIALLTLFFFNQTQTTFSFTEPKTYILIGFAGLIIMSIVPKFIHNKLIASIKPSDPIANKLSKYNTAFFISMALYEGIGLVNSIFFALTGNKVFLIFAAFSILYMLLAKPDPYKIADRLNFSQKERKYIDHPERDFDYKD